MTYPYQQTPSGIYSQSPPTQLGDPSSTIKKPKKEDMKTYAHVFLREFLGSLLFYIIAWVSITHSSVFPVGVLYVAIAYGIGASIIWILFRSCANPYIAFMFLIAGKREVHDVYKFIIRIIAEFGAMFLAGLFVKSLLGGDIELCDPSTYIIGGFTDANIFFIEVIFGYVLYYVYLHKFGEYAHSVVFRGFCVGLVYFVSWNLVGLISGSALNPMVIFAPMIWASRDALYVWPVYTWVYFIAPIASLALALATAFGFEKLNEGKTTQEKSS